MGARVEAAVWSYQRPGTDADWTSVNKGGVEVQHGTHTQEDVEAIVGVQRTTDPGLFLEELVVFFLRSFLRW